MMFMSIRRMPIKDYVDSQRSSFFACTKSSSNVPALSVVFTSSVAFLGRSNGDHTSIYISVKLSGGL